MSANYDDYEGISEVLAFLNGESSKFTESCLEQIFLIALAYQEFSGQLKVYADYDQDDEISGFEIYDDEHSFLNVNKFEKKFMKLFTESPFCEIDIIGTDDEGNSEGQLCFLTEDLELEDFFHTHQKLVERGIKSLTNLDGWHIHMCNFVFKVMGR